MFAKLFGETEELQLQNMKKKVILTAVAIAICIVGAIVSAIGTNAVFAIGELVAVVALFMWGGGAVKALFGIGSIGALFSGNVVLGVVLFVLCVIVAYFIGIFVAILGCGRYIYLIIKRASKTNN